MAISRRTGFWFILLAIPIVLLLAGVVLLKIMFTDERLKEMVVPRAEEALGREVDIRTMSLRVFPPIAMEMEGVTVSNRKGEGFSPSPLLALDAVRVHVKLLPLLAGRIDVKTLEMDGPHLLLEVNKANETNYSDLGTAPTPAVTSPAEPASPPPSADEKVAPSSAITLTVPDLRIRNGVIEYVSYRDDTATRLRGISLDTEVLARGDSLFITGIGSSDSLGYGTVTTPLFGGLRVGLGHRIIYDLAGDVLTFDRGDLTLQDMRLSLAGSISELRGNTGLNLTIGSDSVNIAHLFSLIPKEYSKQTEGLQGKGIAQVRIAVTGVLTDSTQADLHGTISADGASLQYPGLPKPISNIAIVCGFARTRTQQEFHIKKLTARLGDTSVRATMTAVNFDDPSVSLTAVGSLDLATVREYYPLEQGTDLGGRMTADVRLAGRISDLAAIQASGSMQFYDVSAKTARTRNPVRNLNGTVSFNNQVVESRKTSFVIGKSDMTLAFRLANYLSMISDDKRAPRPRATVTLRSSHLYASDIMGEEEAGAPARTETASPTAPPIAREAGVLSPTTTQGRKPARTAEAAEGPAENERRLALPDVEMDINVSIGKLTTEKFEFTNVRGTIKVFDGVITMQDLTLNAFGGSVVSRGTLNLQTPDRPQFDLTLDLNALQANSLLPHFTSFGQRLNGKLTMNTTLKGSLDDTLGIIPSTLIGAGTVALRDGTLKGFRVNQALARSLKLSDLETVVFKNWTNSFSVQDGRFVVKDLRITALNADYAVNGSQGLDGSLDYGLSVYLPPDMSAKVNIPGFPGEAVNLFKDQSGRLKLDFNVGGSTDDPTVRLDTAPAKERAETMAKEKLQQEKQKLEQSVRQKTEDALKKIFKPK